MCSVEQKSSKIGRHFREWSGLKIEVFKIYKIQLSIVYVENYLNLSKKKIIEEYDFRGTIFVIDIFENFNFWTTLFPKMMSNFWRLLYNWAQDLKTF